LYKEGVFIVVIFISLTLTKSTLITFCLHSAFYCSGYAEVLKPDEGGGERGGAPPEPPEEEHQLGGEPAVPHTLHTGYTALHNGTEEQEERISTLTSTLDHMKDRLHSLQEVLKEKDLTDERSVCDLDGVCGSETIFFGSGKFFYYQDLTCQAITLSGRFGSENTDPFRFRS